MARLFKVHHAECIGSSFYFWGDGEYFGQRGDGAAVWSPSGDCFAFAEDGPEYSLKKEYFLEYPHSVFVLNRSNKR